MNSQGLIGFRIQKQDKLAYNQSASRPDMLGLKMLNELRAVDDWNTVRSRIEKLNNLPETQRPGYQDGMLKAELRRHFPDVEFRSGTVDYHDLYRSLQGTLRPYLDGRLSCMPDASDFIRDSRGKRPLRN